MQRRGLWEGLLVATNDRRNALNAVFVGLAAGFWHITWTADVAILASGVVAAAVHSAGYVRLERDSRINPRDTKDSGD